MKLKEALQWGVKALRQGGVEDARIEAECLIGHILGFSRAKLYTEWEGEIPRSKHCSFVALIERRLLGEPLAYLTGHREFYGLDFLVDHRVLIPRPESELLVELALQHLESRGQASAPSILADVGTGSGALAIALAKQTPYSQVFATDISADALEVAAINCRTHGVQDRVTLLHGDLLQPLPGPVDVVVSNPPYIVESDFEALPREIREYEPILALDGGHDGLATIRRLLPQAIEKLKLDGALFMEIGYDQRAEARRLAEILYPDASIGVELDLAGRDRVLTVHSPRLPELVGASGLVYGQMRGL